MLYQADRRPCGGAVSGLRRFRICCEVDEMPMRYSPTGLRADTKLNRLHCELPVPTAEWSAGAPLTYAAFCRDHWPVYARFGCVVAGSDDRGADLALEALRRLAGQWAVVLGSSSPSALAWDLLSTRAASWRTESVGRLHEILERLEADALVLRHRLGISAAQAAHAMGLTEAEFELLRTRALHNLLLHSGP
ncbi:hypothetical protein AB0E08_49405 [Streptomyces sp. NPDC048281]|uniref:hypothetical protein n=1 Tax=Streptomyces sp. NPDC048281 TaxID=3154715 RepID=UPI00342679A6